MGPRASVSALSLLGLVIAGMVLAGERRRPQILARPALTLLAWAVPGMVIGVVALDRLPTRALKVAVAVVILAAIASQALRDRQAAAPTGPAGAAGAGAAGLTAGALTTSVGMNGPPLLLYLMRLSDDPGRIRDTMASLFLATSLLAVVALALGGTFEPPGETVGLVFATLAGQVVGARVFARLHPERWERLVLAALAVLAVVSLVLAVT